VADSVTSQRRAPIGVALLALWLAGTSATLAGAQAPRGGELSVFAAISLADALTEIGKAWDARSGNHTVFNFGASSDLARQIQAGAPADIFFSADTAQIDALERQGLIRAGERRDLLSNTLVVIVPADSTAAVASPRDLLRLASIALADPQAVPAGVYARTWLEGLGLWPALAARVVPTLHVRAALAAVESGNVEAGIVYRTDAFGSRRVRIALEVPREQGPRISYPVAPIAGSRTRAAAAFVAYLASPFAREVFARHGFLVLGGQ
jgi:molybdate transport system substrate-binding protein